MPLSKDSKIPKPPGEPGRPGRGGYTLYEALNWSPKAYAKFKVRNVLLSIAKQLKISQKLTHQLIDDHLETTKCASAQSDVLLKIVRIKVNGLNCNC